MKRWARHGKLIIAGIGAIVTLLFTAAYFDVGTSLKTQLYYAERNPNCPPAGPCTLGPVVDQCHDGKDNDGDGHIDAEDWACSVLTFGGNTREEPDPPCQDGDDNDGDHQVDAEDLGCYDILNAAVLIRDQKATFGTVAEYTEFVKSWKHQLLQPHGRSEIVQVGFAGCIDGIDNDNDKLIDDNDPQCFDLVAARKKLVEWEIGGVSHFVNAMQSESLFRPGGGSGNGENGGAQCIDGKDNDDDSFTDDEDTDCFDNINVGEDRFTPFGQEKPRKTSCSDTVDNDQDGVADADDPDCRERKKKDGKYHPEWNAEKGYECSDGADNDGDGDTDTEDDNCYSGFGKNKTYKPKRSETAIVKRVVEGAKKIGSTGLGWGQKTLQELGLGKTL